MRLAVALALVLGAACFAGDRPLVFGIGPVWGDWVGKDPATFDPAMMDKIAEAGGTCMRSGFDWCNMEPSPGTYVWTEYDRRVDMALSRGLEWVGLICTSPGWANAVGSNDIYPPLEEHKDEYAAFVTALAQHYRGRVTRYEFWNEPDMDFGWKPAANVVEYTKWLKRTYTALKAGDPDAVLAVGGLLGRDMWFLDGIYSNGGKDYFDAVAVHPYSTDYQGEPWIDTKMIADVRAVMAAGDDEAKPLWLTEYGWGVGSVPESTRASYVTQSLALFTSPAYSFIEMANLHTICDWDPSGAPTMGLCDWNLVPREAYDAFRDFPKLPAIAVSGVATSEVTRTTARVTWQTDVPATSQVFYGATSSYGQQTALDSSAVTSHEVVLSGLDEGTTYHFAVKSTASGHLDTTSTDGVFATDGVGVPLVNPGFETGNITGWTKYGTFDGAFSSGQWAVPSHTGSYYAANVTSWGVKSGGCRQGLSVEEGHLYKARAYIFTDSWQGTAENEFPTNARCRLGVDPYGGTSYSAGTVIWTPWSYSHRAWGDLTLEFIAEGANATLFLGANNLSALEWSKMCFDDVSVVRLSDESASPTLVPRWELISIPLEPLSPDAAEVLAGLVEAGNTLTGSVYRWADGSYETYPNGFSNLEPGKGYWMKLQVAAAAELKGTPPSQTVALRQGWNLVGPPSMSPVSLSDLSVTDGVATLSYPEAAAAGWVGSKLYSYSSSGYSMESTALSPWTGYWLRAYRSDLLLDFQ